MLTNQEVFNRVWQNFVVEKAPQSKSEGYYCLYRGPDGKKCAAGLLIPDELYQPGFEKRRFSTLPYNITGLVLSPDFVDYVQQAHDDPQESTFSTDIEARLRRLAAEFRLSVPEPVAASEDLEG